MPRPAIDGDAPAAIVYTSGTTGRSKGAVLTHNNFAANAAALVTCWRITSADRYLAVLPLFHVHGLGNGVCAWLASRLPDAPGRAVRGGQGARAGSRTSSRRSSSACRRSTSACWSCRPTRRARSARGRGCSCRDRRRCPPQVLEQFRERFGHTHPRALRDERDAHARLQPPRGRAPRRHGGLPAAGRLAVGARPAGPAGGDGRRRRGAGCKGPTVFARLLGQPRGDGEGVHATAGS